MGKIYVKAYELVSGTIKKNLQLIGGRKEGRKEGVKSFKFVPICYNLFDTSYIYELKMIIPLFLFPALIF